MKEYEKGFLVVHYVPLHMHNSLRFLRHKYHSTRRFLSAYPYSSSRLALLPSTLSILQPFTRVSKISNKKLITFPCLEHTTITLLPPSFPTSHQKIHTRSSLGGMTVNLPVPEIHESHLAQKVKNLGARPLTCFDVSPL